MVEERMEPQFLEISEVMPSTAGQDRRSARIVPSIGAVLALVLFCAAGGIHSGASILEQEQGFPGVGEKDGGIFAQPDEDGNYGQDLSPEGQAAMQLEWSNIKSETDSQLRDQVAKGEAADLALHKASGYSDAQQNADVGMWQDVPGLPLNRKPGDYMSISGQRVPYYSLQPSVACSSHNPGCMSPGLQVYVNTEVIPVAMPAYDRQMLTEQGRLSQEDVMQQKLRLQGRKVESLTRQLVKKSSQQKEDPLWRGVHVTAQDLRPISKRRQEWEDHLWRVWDRENKHSRTTAAQTVDQLKSARETLATKRGTPEADRANQGEIGALVGATDWLSWEHEPELHYHDLGPDGRQTRLRDSLVLVPGVKKRPNPYCAFCGGPSGGAREAQVDGKKIFTKQDWKDALKGSDFIHTFPDTNDLRVLDWIGAEDQDNDALKDSMSSKGAVVGFPKDWNKFPQAKGTYTAYGIGY